MEGFCKGNWNLKWMTTGGTSMTQETSIGRYGLDGCAFIGHTSAM